MNTLPMILCDDTMLKSGLTYCLKAETLELVFSRTDKLLSISETRTNTSELFFSFNDDHTIDPVLANAELFSLSKHVDVSLSPALPDRPLIVRLKTPVTVLPKTQITVYTELPLHLQFNVKGEKLPVKEVPTRILSNSWLGDVVQGMKCYSLKSPAMTELSQLPGNCTAVCPIILKNNSKTAVPFDKLVVIPDDLSIYKISERLWTDTLTLTYKGNNQIFSLSKTSPDLSSTEGKLLSSPRKPQRDKNFITKALAALQ